MVSDDDFDIDVEELAGEDEGELIGPTPDPGEAAEAVPAAAAKGATRAMSARKPGPWQQLGDKVTAPFARVRLPEWNLTTFAYLLGIVVLLWFLLENLAPCRVRLLVWNTEAPKTVLFIVNLALGVGLLWAWQRYTAARQARRDAATQAAAQPAQEE